MTSIAIAVPLRPEMSATWRDRTRELMENRRDEVEADWRRYGIRRSASWLQRTAHGDLAILYWEVDDPSKLEERSELIAKSEDEYHRSLRKTLAEVFEFGPGQPRPSSELVADFRLEEADQP